LFLHTQRQQEQQRVEKERQRKLQEANEAKKQAQLRQEDLVNKDKIVQEQATLVDMPRKPTKPAPYNKAEKEAEVRKKVQEMQRIRNEQKKVSNLTYRMYNTYIMPYPMTQYHTLYHSIPI
jgi:HD superfamily phosphohydrolase